MVAGSDRTNVPFLVSATDIDLDGVLVRCLVLTDLTAQKLGEQQVAAEVAQAERQRVAAEVNDTIVQGLVAAEMALDLGQVDYARSLVASHVQPREELDRQARGQPCARAGHGRAQRAREPAGGYVTDDLKVLIVDDSEDLRDLLSLVIDRHPHGWHVVATAADGQQAIQVAGSNQPDLVLLDIAMPVMDGMQALPHIREAAPNAVVVMLSGYPFSTAGQGALNAGADGYLEKSDLVKGLIPRLERILESSLPSRPRLTNPSDAAESR